MEWSDEWRFIRASALAHGIDPYFVGAIRKAENGGPGREFGVLSTKATTYQAQLDTCCATVRQRMLEKAPRLRPYRPANGILRLCLNSDWIEWFGSVWAPLGASNDPTHLNANWANNVTILYRHGMDAWPAN